MVENENGEMDWYDYLLTETLRVNLPSYDRKKPLDEYLTGEE